MGARFANFKKFLCVYFEIADLIEISQQPTLFTEIAKTLVAPNGHCAPNELIAAGALHTVDAHV